MNKTLRYTAAIAAIALLSACASNKTATDNNAVKTVDVTNGIGADGVPAPQARSVYFDLDRYTVRTDGQPVVRAHSEFLNKNRNQHVLLQGNTDERGTREYNMALGERRAKAVQRYLVLQGVSPAQLELVSYGEERPVATGNDEQSWAQNRRVELRK